MKINPQTVDQLILGAILVEAGVFAYRLKKYLDAKKPDEVVTAMDVVRHSYPEMALIATAGLIWVYRHGVQTTSVA